MIETEIRDMLGRSLGNEPEFDAERYVTAACRARSRRRQLMCAGGAVLATVALAGAVVAWPAGHRARDQAVTAGTTTASPPSPPSPEPASEAGAARLTAVLRQHFPMPPGTHAVKDRWKPAPELTFQVEPTPLYVDGGPYYTAEFDLTGPDGTGDVTVEVMSSPSGPLVGRCDPAPATCEDRTEADGTRVMWYQDSPEDPDRGVRNWGVEVYRRDGTAVLFRMGNWSVNLGEAKDGADKPSRAGQPVPNEDLIALGEQPDLHM
jgi:hypothetical protein